VVQRRRHAAELLSSGCFAANEMRELYEAYKAYEECEMSHMMYPWPQATSNTSGFALNGTGGYIYPNMQAQYPVYIQQVTDYRDQNPIPKLEDIPEDNLSWLRRRVKEITDLCPAI
jgi:hypothetical protein